LTGLFTASVLLVWKQKVAVVALLQWRPLQLPAVVGMISLPVGKRGLPGLPLWC